MSNAFYKYWINKSKKTKIEFFKYLKKIKIQRQYIIYLKNNFETKFDLSYVEVF